MNLLPTGYLIVYDLCIQNVFQTFFFPHKADAHLDEYNEMFEFIVKWTDRARSLVKANIIWNSSSHLQEQIRMYQVNQNTHKYCVYNI